jgi:glycosidase
MGVDGFRLDAVPYLVEEGTAVSNTPGTHAVLRDFSAAVRRAAPGAFTVGEVWDSIGAIMPYYPDQLDSYFSFELSDALLDAVRTGAATTLLSSYARMNRAMPGTRWSPFLRNHDQTRTVTALGGDRVAARQAAELLLTLPGLPFVYYGEEIGMTGDKPDPRLRTPMQWTPGRAAGFTTGAAWEPLQPDTATANVAVQTGDSASLLVHYRKLIHLRANNPALGGGDFLPLQSSDPAVAAYLRRSGSHVVLVVANLAATPKAGVTITSADGALPAARYTARDLLGGGAGAPLTVGAGGRVNAYVPITTLAPRRTYAFDVTPGGVDAGSRGQTPLKTVRARTVFKGV